LRDGRFVTWRRPFRRERVALHATVVGRLSRLRTTTAVKKQL
jgi:hypothetical protein